MSNIKMTETKQNACYQRCIEEKWNTAVLNIS